MASSTSHKAARDEFHELLAQVANDLCNNKDEKIDKKKYEAFAIVSEEWVKVNGHERCEENMSASASESAPVALVDNEMGPADDCPLSLLLSRPWPGETLSESGLGATEDFAMVECGPGIPPLSPSGKYRVLCCGFLFFPF